MFKLVVNDWGLALYDFVSYLIRDLGDNLRMVIGLSEDSSVYDSNVLVVVRELNDEVRRIVARTAIETNEKHSSTISYYLTDEKDVETIETFTRVRVEEVDDCEEAFRYFYNEIKKYVDDVVFLGGKNYVYDSNVLVFVRELNDEVRRIVARAAIETNEKHKCIISYYLTNNKGLLDDSSYGNLREVIPRSRY
jgi:dsDNA-binding SOS-regulon protein